MKLYNEAMKTIQFISSNQKMPTISKESIEKAYDDGDSIVVNVGDVTDVIKYIVVNQALMELSEMYHLPIIPTQMINDFQFFFDIDADEVIIKKMYIGCDIFLADDWMDCSHDDAKGYINELNICKKNGNFQKSISGMFGTWTIIPVMIWDAEEHKIIADVVREVMGGTDDAENNR